jgi:hypothetical protein
VIVFVALASCGKKETSDARPSTADAAAINGQPGAILVQPGSGIRPTLDAAEIAVPEGKSELHVAWDVPKGTEINDDAPIAVKWKSSDGLATTPSDITGHGKDIASGFDISIEPFAGASGGQLAGDLDLVVCDIETHAVCVPIKRRIELTFAVGKGNAKGKVTLPLPKAKAN